MEDDNDDNGEYNWKRGKEREDVVEDDVLEGVDDLPLFANEENKRLHAAVKAKESRCEYVDADIKDTKSRVEIMEEHLKNVKQELVHTQSLLDSKTKALASEDHIKQIAMREVGRVKQDIGQLDIQLEEAMDALNSTQNYVYRGNEKMDAFKLQMNWKQEELEQWAVAAKQKEEDTLALEKYTRSDDVKIKELILNIEKLTKQVGVLKSQLEEETTETQAKQIELEKAAGEFRNLHLERQKLVQQWQDTIEAMKRRDGDIQDSGVAFAALKEKHEKQRILLGENKMRLEIQEQENLEMQSKISAKERSQAKARQDLQRASGKLQEFKDEVEIMKSELSSAAAQLMQQRGQNTNRIAELEEKKLLLEQDRNRYKATKKKLELYKSRTMDAETVAKQVEDDMVAKELELKTLTKDISQLKEVLFRHSQELFNHRQDEANMIAEISGAEAAGRNLQTKIKQLDIEALRQQELVYNGEFQIQQLERKVARASGIRTVDETKALTAEIEVLKVDLDKARAQHSMLTTQCRKVEDEYKRQLQAKMVCAEECKALQSKIAELQLENESSMASVHKAQREKEEVLVKHDVLKLEMKRLKEVLNARADEVFTLENRKFQLQMSMEERKKEIAVHRDVQRAQLKHAQEERHKASVEFSERRMHVEKLQSKYETLCKLTGFAADDDEDDGVPQEEKTQAYFVIKAAQKREELQRSGDDLDDKIQVAERELRALQKSLSHVAVRNTEYRKSFHRVDKSSEDGQKVHKMESQSHRVHDELFQHKKELQRLQTELEEETQRYQQLVAQNNTYKDHIDHLNSANEQVLQEVAIQKDKVTRAELRVSRYIKKHRSNKQTNSETLEEIAYATSGIKEVTGTVLYTLGQLASEYPEMSDDLFSALKKHNLHIPIRPQSRISSTLQSRNNTVRPMSACSDKSDVSSISQSSISSIHSTRHAVSVSHVQLGV